MYFLSHYEKEVTSIFIREKEEATSSWLDLNRSENLKV